ncbi:MAG: hypothetical protein AAGH89_16775 [Verrucomicrobiota bacterium]
METEVQLQDEPRRCREVLPSQAREVGSSTEGIFTTFSGAQALSEVYSLSWDSARERWVLWAQCKFLEPVKMVASQKGTKEEEPNPTELIAALWEARTKEKSASLSAVCATGDHGNESTVQQLADRFADSTKHQIIKEKPPLLG